MKTEADLKFRALLAGATKIFWAGTKPPLARMYADARIYSPDDDYRLSGELHETFDLVCLNEIDLGSVKAWPIVVDEALRLLSPEGVLLIRACDSPFLSIFALKNQLFCWGELSPYFEHKFADGSYMFALKNERKEKRMASAQVSVSFGVITDGKRTEQLDRFVFSVEALHRDDGQKVEVIICGPAELDITRYQKRLEVSLVPEPDDFKELGWITRKKNLLVEKAKYENLVVVHDRYFLPIDFLKCLKVFGFDFDVMTCRQVAEDGRRVPDWVTLGDAWLWTAPGILSYGDWTPYVYINGGLIIAKTKILRGQPWNDLLFWMQAEDVELTRRLYTAGHVPRFARGVIANTNVLRRGSIETMEAVPKSKTNYWLPNPTGWGDRQLVLRSVSPASTLQLSGVDEERIASQGVYLDDVWSIGTKGVSLPAGVRGEITFRLAWLPASELLIDLLVCNPKKILEVSVNGIPAGIVALDVECLRLVCPWDAFKFSSVLRLEIFPASDLLLRNIQVEKSMGILNALINPASFGRGKSFFLKANNFIVSIFLHMKKSSRLRRFYNKLKRSELLRSSPLAHRIYRYLRKLVG